LRPQSRSKKTPRGVAPVFPNRIQLQVDDPNRIVGGSPSASGQFPFIVSLRRTSHSCGASILTTRTVVTAAHCIDGVSASSLSIRYNSLNHGSGGALVNIQTINKHAGYSASTLDNDIATLITTTALTLGQTNARAVTLAASGNDPASGTNVIAIGWGTTSEGGSIPAALRHVTVPIVARATCNSNYGGGITNNMICAGVSGGGLDACQGDSGGPLVVASSSVLVGLTSWGRGCARPGYPGVYTRIGPYITWINNNSV